MVPRYVADLKPQQGSINQERLLSTTNRTLNAGKTFGVTADAMRQGQFYKQQRLATNKQVASIAAKNAAFYKRGN